MSQAPSEKRPSILSTLNEGLAEEVKRQEARIVYELGLGVWRERGLGPINLRCAWPEHAPYVSRFGAFADHLAASVRGFPGRVRGWARGLRAHWRRIPDAWRLFRGSYPDDPRW
ncbi:MAG: hypothetical protein GY795_11395 [Desulfobacterales bacterium]|nr:hypothetical protein [Desulfobacterales bacterium]